MTADQLISHLTSAAFIFIFLVVLNEAVRTRRTTAINAAIFFGALAGIVFLSVLTRLGLIRPSDFSANLAAGLLLLVPYLQLRMVHDLDHVRRTVRGGAAAITIGSALSLFLVARPYNGVYTIALIAGFVLVQGYATYRLLRATLGTAGAARARSRALVLGSAMLVALIIVAGLQAFFPAHRGLWRVLTSTIGVACGVGYFLGFAPPGPVRRLWQAPAIRQFLSIAARLPTEYTTQETAAQLEESVRLAIGATHASITVWDVATRNFFSLKEGRAYAVPDHQRGRMLVARVFREQRPLLVDDATMADPVNADTYRAFEVASLLAAPITLGDQRFGVLSAWSGRPSRFAKDDLDLLVLLADEIAGLLHRHQLTETAAHVRAQQEATQLKEEFLSAAAHDLRTPLTVILAQAQLLSRRLQRSAAVTNQDLVGIDRLLMEARRMRRLTDDVLDASRSEATGFVRELGEADLVALAEEAAGSVTSDDHRVVVEGHRMPALVDADRIRQVMQNLVDNAVKFSPQGGRITIRCGGDDEALCFSVEDEGIGIPPWDLPHLFQRFYRGGGSAEQGFSGMGIGLFLCKRIVEEHGGTIGAESVYGEGTRFYVRLPRPDVDKRRANATAHSRS